ncbi:MAG: hypothetical protein OHK0013_21400 [Sandaracinaceae bacterium]
MSLARARSLSLALALGLAGVACSDPAEGVAVATVSEPTGPTPPSAPSAPPTEGTTAPAAPSEPARQRLAIDRAGSMVGFTGAKVTASHDGTFGEFSGTIELAPEITDSRVQVTIQMASLAIEPERLRDHLLSPDLFGVEQFPTATFESTRIVADTSGQVGGQPATHAITGNLTLHGQTRAITFPAIVSVSDAEVTANAEFVIDRRDFGIVYPGLPDDLIRDEVVVRFRVRAPRS